MSVILLLDTPVSEFHSPAILWTQLPSLQVPLGVAFIVTWQLFSSFLTIINKHARVNTDVLIQIPPCDHTPLLERNLNGRKYVLVSGEPALLFWLISWGRKTENLWTDMKKF